MITKTLLAECFYYLAATTDHDIVEFFRLNEAITAIVQHSKNFNTAASAESVAAAAKNFRRIAKELRDLATPSAQAANWEQRPPA
ncbi:MAG: hypothetical protein OXI87_10165 [Albidovulum sp.]|nr:hypothetical protein [Albidovulum sp.]